MPDHITQAQILSAVKAGDTSNGKPVRAFVAVGMANIVVEVHVAHAEDLVGGGLAEFEGGTQELGLQVVIFASRRAISNVWQTRLLRILAR